MSLSPGDHPVIRHKPPHSPGPLHLFSSPHHTPPLLTPLPCHSLLRYVMSSSMSSGLPMKHGLRAWTLPPGLTSRRSILPSVALPPACPSTYAIGADLYTSCRLPSGCTLSSAGQQKMPPYMSVRCTCSRRARALRLFVIYRY